MTPYYYERCAACGHAAIWHGRVCYEDCPCQQFVMDAAEHARWVGWDPGPPDRPNPFPPEVER